MSFALTTTGRTLLGGVNAIAGHGQTDVAAFLNAFKIGDRYSVVLTNAKNGRQTLVGAGNATGAEPVFAFVHDDKVYALSGATVYFCALSDPTQWNTLTGVGNGFVTLSNKLSNPEDLTGLAIYQGKGVFCSRNTTLIYRIDPDPANWSLSQTLPNIGTFAGETLKALGEMEVLMLADSGIRSLRTREASLNAFVVDIGSPIDRIVAEQIGTLTESQKASACAVVEPSANRYWCFIPGATEANGTIFVLSYFPTSQIIAWSQYDPSYEVETEVSPQAPAVFGSDGTCTVTGLTIGDTYRFVKGDATKITCGTEVSSADGDFVARATSAVISGPAFEQYEDSGTHVYWRSQTFFVPQNFVVYGGQVYCRDADALYRYGGSDNATFDACVCEAEPPWMDAKSPSTRKHITGMDAAMEGRWDVSIGTDPSDEAALKLIYANTGSSFFLGTLPAARVASFYKLNMKSRGSGAARFCSVAAQFEKGDSR